MELFAQQTKAIDLWEDNITTELLYGGGAGGGKSVLGCYCILKSAFRHSGTRYVIGRAVLKTLQETTLKTFWEVCRIQGIKPNVHLRYNANSNIITLYNGSEIFLKDLALKPSDKDFDELGSLEITGAFVDECNQIVEKAWEILKSRIRFRLDEYNLIPKILGSCNPARNWVYRRFYDPWQKGTLPSDRQFIQSLVTDNKNISKHYISNLQGLTDPASKARLLKGDWEYINNPNALCKPEAINAIFDRHIAQEDKYYITADIARFGQDEAIIAVWKGWAIVEYKIFDVSKTTDIQLCINAFRVKYNIPPDKAIADEDGVGGGVVDNCGIMGFVNNSSPLLNPDTDNEENYSNLQAQCGYKISEIINAGLLSFEAEIDGDTKDMIITELGQLQTWKADSDTKLKIKPKSEIINEIGHSPNWRDVILMRAFFYYTDTDKHAIFPITHLREGVLQRKEGMPHGICMGAMAIDDDTKTICMLACELYEGSIYVQDILYGTIGQDINDALCADFISHSNSKVFHIGNCKPWKNTLIGIRDMAIKKAPHTDIRIVKEFKEIVLMAESYAGFISRNLVFRPTVDNNIAKRFMHHFSSFSKLRDGRDVNKEYAAVKSCLHVAAYFNTTYKKYFDN